MEYVLTFAGLVLLLVAGNYLVKGSVSFARHLKISTLVVGIVVVAVGTSAPELVVSVKAALSGHPDIAIGNVVGSNISNIALVLAISAIILPIPIKKSTIKYDWPVMMLISIVFYLLAMNLYLESIEGIFFVILLVGYILFSLWSSRKEKLKLNEEELKARFPLWLSIIIIVVSCVGLVYGANFLIDGITVVAHQYNISERVISISVVAVGTSLPELATSVIAAIQKESDISIGNIIGSNIFNILGVLGVTSIVKKIPVNEMVIQFDVFWMLGVSLLLFLFFIPFRDGRISRIEGAILLMVYILYMYFLFG